MESYFGKFRNNIIGCNHEINTPYGLKKLVYADWTASGRLYGPIETFLQQEIYPYVANTHTETTTTGTLMTRAYHEARNIIKKHVNASDTDVMVLAGSGMTGAVNKFQRILGLKMYERVNDYLELGSTKVNFKDGSRPVVFITHMEHHSNHTSWLETIADVEIIRPDSAGLVDLAHLQELIEKYANRKFKIASVTACSNVTGIRTDYHQIAKMMHRVGGFCFVDFACSAPYVEINMHPADDGAHLDAIFFSPHKFLGGPGTEGIVIFNKQLYHNAVPDHPGGGTVTYTNPWAMHRYINDIEEREDGGTPPFLQAIKTALAIRLKEEMGSANMLKREEEILERIFGRLEKIKYLNILAARHKHRLGVISFYINNLHYNLGVKLLNDRFGIQTRGGCACAGTYGHFLLNVDQPTSLHILEEIERGNISTKPGWIRLSIHPVMTNAEVDFIMDAIEQLATNFGEWSKDYTYISCTNSFTHKKGSKAETDKVKQWFVIK